MRRFVALLGREWREVRAVTWVSMALVVAACAVVRWVIGAAAAKNGDVPTDWYLEPLVPVCVMLYAAVVAADSVGGETATGRIDGLVLLPVRPLALWTAKAASALACVTVFAAWAVLVQVLVLWGVDGQVQAERFFARAGGNLWILPFTAGFTALALLVSTLRLRGIAAFVVTFGAAAGLVAAGAWYASLVGWRGPGRLAIHLDRTSVALASGMVVAILAASAAAFAGGRVHLGRVLRPATIALSALLVLVGGPAAAYAWSAFRVIPGTAGVHLSQAWPSPDGRFVAITFVNALSPAQPHKTFVLDVERDRLVEPEFGAADVEIVPGAWDGVWDGDGNLELWDFSRATGGIRHGRVDPATGATLSSERLTGAEYSAHAKLRYAAWNESLRWYVERTTKCDDGGPPLAALIREMRGPGRVEIRTHAPAVVMIPRRQVFYFPEPCVLSVRELPDGAERRLLTAREPWRLPHIKGLTADGNALMLQHDGAWKVLDVATGAVTDLPTTSQPPSWWGVIGDGSRRIVVLPGLTPNAQEVEIRDLASGARAVLPKDDTGSARAIGGGRLLVQRNDGLDLMDADLRVVKRVWPLDAARRPR